MVKFLRLSAFLLILLLSEISNAQYCSFSLTTAGFITNERCYGISVQEANRLFWCPAHPNDPVCPSAPTCQSTTQTQTIPCPYGQQGQITQTQTSTCPSPNGVSVPGQWVTTSNSCQVIWQTQTQTLSCPAHYSGSITQTRQTTTSGQTTGWQTVSNTCVQDPPTCQVQSQSQVVSCPTGYTGSISQSRISACPDPYGSPVWGAWATTASTCQQSVTNISNPTSPISPLSPTSTQTLPSTPAAVSQSTSQVNPQSVMTQQMNVPDAAPATPSTPQPTSTNQPSATQTSAPATNSAQTPQSPPKGKISVGGLGLAPSLAIMAKPGLVQPSLFPQVNFGQEIPKEILLNDQTMMGLLAVDPITQTPLKEELDLSQ